MVAGQSPAEGDREARGVRRVLRVALLVASPAWVTQQVHHGRPGLQAVDTAADAGWAVVVEGAQFQRDGLGDVVHQLLVPGRAQPHRLREDRGRAEPGDAVQGLGPGPERRDAKARHGRRVLVQHRDPLIEREPFEQVVDALVQRQLGVAERQPLGRGHGRGTHVATPRIRPGVEALRTVTRGPLGCQQLGLLVRSDSCHADGVTLVSPTSKRFDDRRRAWTLQRRRAGPAWVPS